MLPHREKLCALTAASVGVSAFGQVVACHVRSKLTSGFGVVPPNFEPPKYFLSASDPTVPDPTPSQVAPDIDAKEDSKVGWARCCEARLEAVMGTL